MNAIVTQVCPDPPRVASAVLVGRHQAARLLVAEPGLGAYWNDRTMPATSVSAPLLIRRSVGGATARPRSR